MNEYDVKSPSSSTYDTEAAATDVSNKARDAMETVRSYAKDSADAAGRQMQNLKGQFDHARQRSEQYVADQPVRAAWMAAAGGAVLTALLVSLMRGGRR
ncbi:MAG: hypothetical protein WKG52_11005 [Variovorax sp.]